MARRFVLLDRDGTIIEDRHYLSDPDGVALIPGAAAGLRDLRALGLGLAVITNQSGIGRGYFDRERLAEIHARFEALLAKEDVAVDGIFFCPHTPDDACACRKPRTGLPEQAAEALGFDPKQAFVVGDLPSDIALGRNLGATNFLVRTGHGTRTEAEGGVEPDYVVDDLAAAAARIAGLVEDSD